MDHITTLLIKRSEPPAGEVFLLNATGILPFLITHIRKKKFDSKVLSKNTICLKLKNKVTFEKSFAKIESIGYDGIKEHLEINANGKKSTLSLKAFKITYEEAKLIREKLSAFTKSLQKSL